jgi:GrpB-like predicted nucleotidyltransferase (UPF0157 family)
MRIERCRAFVVTAKRKYARIFTNEADAKLSISTSINEDGVADVLITGDYGSDRIAYLCGLAVNAELLQQSLAGAMRDREAKLKKRADTLRDFLAENPDIQRQLAKFERQRWRQSKAST